MSEAICSVILYLLREEATARLFHAQVTMRLCSLAASVLPVKMRKRTEKPYSRKATCNPQLHEINTERLSESRGILEVNGG